MILLSKRSAESNTKDNQGERTEALWRRPLSDNFFLLMISWKIQGT